MRFYFPPSLADFVLSPPDNEAAVLVDAAIDSPVPRPQSCVDRGHSRFCIPCRLPGELARERAFERELSALMRGQLEE